MNVNIPHDNKTQSMSSDEQSNIIDLNKIILDESKYYYDSKKYLLLVDEENLERLTHLIEKYEQHLKLVRGKYKKINESKTTKTKDPITFKILKSF